MSVNILHRGIPCAELVAFSSPMNNIKLNYMPDHPLQEHKSGGMEQIVEFAGRACYQSFNKPNERTRNADDYIRNIIDQGHESVLEHVSFTFYIRNVSRSFTHELVRHRHLSFSQQSQRYVDESDSAFVVPPALSDEDAVCDVLRDFSAETRNMYENLVSYLQEVRGLKRKQAREAARCVLPNGTETSIVVTGNLRSWREFVKKRMHPAADREIAAVAKQVYQALCHQSPAFVHGIPTPWNGDFADE